jgi:hypothetical protein
MSTGQDRRIRIDIPMAIAAFQPLIPLEDGRHV